MANQKWVVRARKFLNEDIEKLRTASTDLELRLSMMDSHAALENALRGYLSDVVGMEGIEDKSKMNFPSLVQALREETGDSIITAGMERDLLTYNSIRNRVVHDAYQPSHGDVQSGLSLADGIVKRLLGDDQHVPSFSWQDPFYSVAEKLGGDFTYNLGVMLIIFSVLYIINPVDIPGPLDDVGITAPCIFSAAMLINAARMIRNRSKGK